MRPEWAPYNVRRPVARLSIHRGHSECKQARVRRKLIAVELPGVIILADTISPLLHGQGKAGYLGSRMRACMMTCEFDVYEPESG
jgi:hypothetical protein